MPTVADLGQELKKQYPDSAYKNYSDAELGSMAKRKYPQQYGDYTDMPPLPLTPQPGSSSRPNVQPGRSIAGDLPTGREVAGMAVESLPTIGGAVGALATPWAGGVPGAVAGGALGSAAEQLIKHKVGTDKLSGETYQAENPPGTLGGSVWEAVKQGGLQGAAELGGKVLTGILSGPLHGATSTIENEVVKETSNRYNLRLSANEMAEGTKAGSVIDFTQRVGEYSLPAQTWIKWRRNKSFEAGLGAIDDMLATINPPRSPREAREMLGALMKAGKETFQSVAGDFYKEVDRLGKNVTVNMRDVKARALREIAEDDALKAHYPDRGLNLTARGTLESLAKGPDDVPFEIAHNLRKDYVRMSQDKDLLGGSAVQQIASRYKGEITQAMDDSAKALNPEAAKAWKNAREFYSNGATVFTDEVVQGLTNKKDGLRILSNSIDPLRPEAVENVSVIRKVLLDYADKHGDADQKQLAQGAWRQFQEQFIRTHILDDPEHLGGKEAIEKLFQKPTIIRDRVRGLGVDLREELFGGSKEGRQVINNLEDIGNAWARFEKLPTEGRKFGYEFWNAAINFGAWLHGSETAGQAIGRAAFFEGMPILVVGSVQSKSGTAALVDGLGGIFALASEQSAMGKAGRRVVQLTANPEFRAKTGKVVTDLARAWSIYEKERNREKQALEKSADQIDSRTPFIPAFH